MERCSFLRRIQLAALSALLAVRQSRRTCIHIHTQIAIVRSSRLHRRRTSSRLVKCEPAVEVNARGWRDDTALVAV